MIILKSAMEGKNMSGNGALAGLVVLDMTRVLAGPFAGMMLARIWART